MNGKIPAGVGVHHHARTTCPHCGRENQCQTGRGTELRPKDGDVSLCFGCGGASLVVVSAEGLRLRLPTPAEDDEIGGDPRVIAARGEIVEWGRT